MNKLDAYNRTETFYTCACISPHLIGMYYSVNTVVTKTTKALFPSLRKQTSCAIIHINVRLIYKLSNITVVSQPTTASIETRPCFNSASLRNFTSKVSANPIGSNSAFPYMQKKLHKSEIGNKMKWRREMRFL